MEHHFQKSYKAHIDRALQRLPKKQAMEQAIGGEFRAFGILESNLLFQYGLTPTSSLVDVGCGSGRLAYALRDFDQLKYLGTDISPPLLKYAKKVAQRPDWRFEKTTGLSVPVKDSAEDFVCAFSVFTHLRHEETYLYLAEIKRILKPGGRLVFSFLDFSVPAHWTVFEKNIAEIGTGAVLNQFMDEVAIHKWCDSLGLKVIVIHPGNEDHIVLQEPTELEDGRVLIGTATMGQSTCIVEKPA